MSDAHRLFVLLDEIDSASDLAKDDLDYFKRRVLFLAEQRNRVMNPTDKELEEFEDWWAD